MQDEKQEVYGTVNVGPEGETQAGDWIQTYTGVKFHLMDAKPGDFRIVDIAHALSNVCRFSGHVREFYSVAEHSVRVARCLRDQEYFEGVQLAGLMHDASEAYICDMARPFKNLAIFKVYRDVEAYLMGIIADKFEFREFARCQAIKRADEILLGTEARDLLGDLIDGWRMRYASLDQTIEPWSPRKAKREFLAEYERLNLFGWKIPRKFGIFKMVP